MLHDRRCHLALPDCVSGVLRLVMPPSTPKSMLRPLVQTQMPLGLPRPRLVVDNCEDMHYDAVPLLIVLSSHLRPRCMWLSGSGVEIYCKIKRQNLIVNCYTFSDS